MGNSGIGRRRAARSKGTKAATVLAIESSAHTLGVAVARREAGGGAIRILSNASAKYPSGAEGYIPRKLADFHAKNFPDVLAQSLALARVPLSGMDCVAFTRGPGIGHCLQVGCQAAKALGAFLGVPVIPVNHAIAHAQVVSYFERAADPLVVYVSGGNTQIAYRRGRRYAVLGETLDIGIGNFLDQLGRTLRLEPPDAVGVLTLAAKPGARYVEMPYVVKGMSVSYSGMLTYAEKLAREGRASGQDIAFSAQETAFAALCEAAERALLHAGKREIVLCGGNARNRRLSTMMRLVAEENGARLCVGKDEYLGDNAAMIALTALRTAGGRGIQKDIKPEPVQDLRIDSEDLGWGVP